MPRKEPSVKTLKMAHLLCMPACTASARSSSLAIIQCSCMCRVRMMFTMRVQQLTSNGGSGNNLMFLSTPELAGSAGECRYSWGYHYGQPVHVPCHARVHVNKSFRFDVFENLPLQRNRPYRERCS
jgi:hypothetical protein